MQGKTLQAIALIAHLIESPRGLAGPVLVVAPLSVVSNWRDDVRRFAPRLAPRLHVFHGGAPRDRVRALRSFLSKLDRGCVDIGFADVLAAEAGSDGEIEGDDHADNGDGDAKSGISRIASSGLARHCLRSSHAELLANIADAATATSDIDLGSAAIVITTYELAVRNERALARTQWSLVVVDEGHRLKNPRSKLAASLNALRVSRRLLLTGTPLQNNLTELWALLHFLLPALFDSAEAFEDWFAAPLLATAAAASNVSGSVAAAAAAVALPMSAEEQAAIIARLHSIVRPFLLRRIKADVALEVPPKTEHTLHVPMSALQAAVYERLRRAVHDEVSLAAGTHVNHDADDASKIRAAPSARSLQNALMALRQVCNHPFLVLEPHEAEAAEEAIASIAYDVDSDSDEARMSRLVRASGKFEVLHRLLPRFRAAGRRVLIFSQFTSVIDLLQHMIEDGLAMPTLRIDGNVRAADRESALRAFNAPSSPQCRAAHVFLLSTRAGGLGINLQTADTVIIFDSDWNPQVRCSCPLWGSAYSNRRDATFPPL